MTGLDLVVTRVDMHNAAHACPATPDNAFSVLQQADGEIQRMSGLLRQMWEASPAAVGRVEIHPESADMPELVKAALDRLDPPNTHARCKLEIAPGVITTGVWDSELVERVLGNLLSNAAILHPESPIHVDLSIPDEAIEVAVWDGGMGLAHHELGQLFQRYTRTKRAADAGAEGAGLGLFVCRRIVEADGGLIWAESDGVGRAAMFHVRLPRAHGAPADRRV